MAKAIKTLASGLTIGLAKLGIYGDGRGSVTQEVHDGDTVTVEADGNISVRLLGIDTPEVSFTLPDSNRFRSIGSDDWDNFLNDPFANAPAAFTDALGAGLVEHLTQAIGTGCAANHAHYAEVAHRHFEDLVSADMQVLQQDRDTFSFFMAFAHEIMDGYGRFLCFINRSQEHANDPEPRPRSYNERLLQDGMASPYFIWPNINPFRREFSVLSAVPKPSDIQSIANDNDGLGPVRQWIKTAREQNLGMFNATDPLRLRPFELRFLSRQSLPTRWVIDLTSSVSETLIHPTQYYQIPNEEDRLFIPPEYVPLFVENGWHKQSSGVPM